VASPILRSQLLTREGNIHAAARPQTDRLKVEPPRKRHEPDHDLWDQSLRKNLTVKVALLTGDMVVGSVVEFGLDAVAIKTAEGDIIVVFKRAIAAAQSINAPTQ
jgi:hypothetical protein